MEHERIETTLPKAKELRRYAERVITLGKKGTLSARRRAMTLIRRKSTMFKVFDELAPRFTDRPGGYTRIYRLGPRKSDQTPMAFVELVDRKEAKKPQKASTKKASKDKGKDVPAPTAKEEKAPAKEKSAPKDKSTKKESASSTQKKKTKK
jgi:large subunit ribosomal protein L17